MYFFTYETPIGLLTLGEENAVIVRVWFETEHPADDGEQKETPLIAETAQQLKEYFSGERRNFMVPYHAQGTRFMQKIWKLIEEIPYGKTRTYGELAALAGIPGGARAVGLACGKNPVALLIPCHRVVAKGENIGGYRGNKMRKKQLLDYEAENIGKL